MSNEKSARGKVKGTGTVHGHTIKITSRKYVPLHYT